MPKNFIKALYVIVPMVILALILANWDKIKAAWKSGLRGVRPSGTNPGTGTNTGQDIVTLPLNLNKVLKKGVSGQEVKELQKLLNQYGGASLVVDGIFGPLTEAALQSWIGKTQTTLNEIQGN